MACRRRRDRNPGGCVDALNQLLRPAARTRLVPAACLCILLGPVAAGPSAGAARAAERQAGPAGQALAAIERRQFVRARRPMRQIRDGFARDAVKFAFYLRHGNPAEAGEIIGFAEEHPDWPLQSVLARRVEGALPGRTSAARMLAWFARRPPVTAAGCVRHIDLLDGHGGRQAAGREISRCWRTLTMPAATEKNFFRKYGRRISHADRAARIRWHLDRGRHRSAHRLIRFHKLAPRHAVPLRVRIDLQRKLRPRTVAGLLKRLRRMPAEARAEAGFRFDLARWNRRRGELEAARAGLAALPAPAAALAGRRWREHTFLVHETLRAQHPARAYAVAASHRQTSGYRFAGAENLAGWIALRKRGKSETALKHFHRIHGGSHLRDLRAMAAWWIGETWRGRRRPGEAEIWYRKAAPASFVLHGQLSRMRLEARTLVLPPDTAAIPPDARAAFDRETAVRLARFYGRNGAGRESRPLLWSMIRTARRDAGGDGGDLQRHGRRLTLIAELAAELGQRHLAVRAARRALARGFVRSRLAYPVIALPKRLPVEQALVLAVIRQESEFNTRARSGAGARGLMQLLPSTARFAARHARTRWSPGRLIRDPAYNIRLGSAYLAYLLNRFEGSYLLAAAAYNAGPTRAARWVARFGHPDLDIDPVDWIESIPFGETRNFVRRVLANVAVYRLRLGDDRLAATPAVAWRAPGSPPACAAAGRCRWTRAPAPDPPADSRAASPGAANAAAAHDAAANAGNDR